MTIFLFMSAIIAGIIFKKSKASIIYMVTVMIILAAFNYENADLDNYIVNYNNIRYATTLSFRYWGYTSFSKLWADLGLNFEHYRIVFYAITFSGLTIAISLMTTKVNYVLAFYMIFSYALDVVQMKYFLGEVFAFLGTAILLKTLNKPYVSRKQTIKMVALFIFLSVAGALIHFSIFYYFLSGTLFVLMRNKKYVKSKIFILVSICGGLLYGGMMGVIIHQANALGVIGEMEYLNNLSLRRTHLGFIFSFIWCILLILSTYFITYPKKKDGGLQKSINDYVLTSVLLMPLLVINVIFARLFRVYMILMYVSYANEKKSRIISMRILFAIVFFYITIAYAFARDVFPVYKTTLGALLKYNMLFK